jgi:hypothetical protein
VCGKRGKKGEREKERKLERSEYTLNNVRNKNMK